MAEFDEVIINIDTLFIITTEERRNDDALTIYLGNLFMHLLFEFINLVSNEGPGTD